MAITFCPLHRVNKNYTDWPPCRHCSCSQRSFPISLWLPALSNYTAVMCLSRTCLTLTVRTVPRGNTASLKLSQQGGEQNHPSKERCTLFVSCDEAFLGKTFKNSARAFTHIWPVSKASFSNEPSALLAMTAP